VFSVLLLASAIFVGVHATSSGGPHPKPDYHLSTPLVATSYHGPCRSQEAQWYQTTGRTDISALAAASAAITQVQIHGGDPAGLQHAGLALETAANAAAKDAMPRCADMTRAWPAMTGALADEGFDLSLTDTADATGSAGTAIMDTRIVRAELPASWFPAPKHKRKAVHA
jgi:hypothetical protein